MDMTTSTSSPDSSISPTHSLTYWNSIPSTVNGMLGGYPQISRIDLQGSSNFLTKLRRKHLGPQGPRKPLPKLERVVDCGAGIGRITRGLLLEVGRVVDVVEPVEKFTGELVRLVGEKRGGGEGDEVGEVVNLGLQDWTPEGRAYDLIWNQWCLGHLTDAQLIAYLERCKKGLAVPPGDAREEEGQFQGAWIVVKENMSTDPWGRDIYDEEDSSVTRTDEKFKKCFKEAGLKIVASEVQRGFPKELFPVRIYALQPE